MNRIPSTASLKGEAERQAEAHSSASSSWLACWPQWRTQRGLLTIVMCLLLVCAAFMGVFGYGFGLGRLTDRCRPACQSFASAMQQGPAMQSEVPC